jgi:hypothetical protein
MRLQEIAIIACILPAQFALLRTHDRLRMWEPGTRAAVGAAGIVAAVALLFLGTQIIPRPPQSDSSLLQDLLLGGFIGLIAVISVLSLMQIAGGAVQAFQRLRHHRRVSARNR